jgi:hypothetical protein
MLDRRAQFRAWVEMERSAVVVGEEFAVGG